MEFYCLTCDKPICVNCMINGDHSGENTSRHSTYNIKEVYGDAIHETEIEDANISKKTKLIKNHINQINDKIKELGQYAKEVEEAVYEMLRRTLNDLTREFKKKHDILKSDLVELKRQQNEISYVQEFVKLQAKCMRPVSFLKIWSSYKNYKRKLQEQKTTITDIQVQLKLDGKPIITSDSGHSNIDIENSNNEKKNVIDLTRKSIVNQITQKSTSFRSQLINRAAKTGLKEFNPFAATSYMKSSLVPTAPSKMPSSYGDPNKEFRSDMGHEKVDDKQDVRKKIERAFNKFEEKLKGGEFDLIATEAVKRSLYGVFAENYQVFKNNAVSSVVEETFKKVFKGSAILTDIHRIILYFNLPFYNYSEPAIPKKIFPVSEDYSIKAMLEAFEKKGLTLRQPNVIIMKVDKDLIVGGYASHGWSISEKKRGDDS